MKKDYIAVIQVGGKGTRMAELTKDEIPKPMLRMNGKPMLEWQIAHISRYGIQDFVIILGHLGHKVREYFEDGRRLGVRIQYVEEREPLGSAGALSMLKTMLTTPSFLFVYGDVMFDLDLNRMFNLHEAHGGQATRVVNTKAQPI